MADKEFVPAGKNKTIATGKKSEGLQFMAVNEITTGSRNVDEFGYEI